MPSNITDRFTYSVGSDLKTGQVIDDRHMEKVIITNRAGDSITVDYDSVVALRTALNLVIVNHGLDCGRTTRGKSWTYPS